MFPKRGPLRKLAPIYRALLSTAGGYLKNILPCLMASYFSSNNYNSLIFSFSTFVPCCILILSKFFYSPTDAQ
jgi:hypothetical protein